MKKIDKHQQANHHQTNRRRDLAGGFIAQFLLTYLAYLLSAKIGAVSVIAPSEASVIWPAAGVALAAVHVYGYRVGVAVFLASLTHALSTNSVSGGTDILVACAIAFGSTLQALVGCYLIKNLWREPLLITSIKELIVLFVIGGLVACVVSAGIGSVSLMLADFSALDQLLRHFTFWWFGDVFGVSIFGPIWIIVFAHLKNRSSIEKAVIAKAKLLTIAIPMAAYLVLFLSIFLVAKTSFEETSQQEYYLETENIAFSFEKDLANKISSVEAVASFYNASNSVDAKEFEIFTKPLLENSAGLYGLSWLPRVEGRDRKAFVDSIREQGFSDYQITSRTKEGKLTRSKDESVYFPLGFTEPYEQNKAAHGFNVYGVDGVAGEVRRKILDDARDLGQARATNRFSIVQKQDEYGFIIYYPLYTSISHDSIASRREQHVGYINAILVFPNLVAELLEEVENLESEFILREVSVTPSKLLFDSRTSNGKEGLDSSYDFSAAMFATHLIKIAGQQWDIVFVKNTGLLSDLQFKSLWIYLLAGLLLAFLFLMLLTTVAARNELVESVVEKRTKEVKELSEAMENAVEGVSQIDEEGRYTYLNDAYASICGYLPEELVGVAWEKTVHPDDHAMMNASYQNMLKVGRVVDEPRGLRKDGSIFHKRTTMISRFDSEGEFVGHHCFMSDISARKEADEQLNILGSAVENSNDVVIITKAENLDEGLEIVYVNQAFEAVTGYKKEEAIGQTPRMLQNMNSSRGTLDSLRENLSQGLGFRGELLNVSKHGVEYWIELNIFPIKNEQGKLIYFAAVERDVTERRISEQKLKQANQELEEFAYRTSHDLRSPLVSSINLVGVAETLIDEKDEAEAKNVLRLVQNSLGKLEILVTDILALTKTKNEDEAKELVDLEALIDESLGKISHLVGFDKILIETKLTFSTPIYLKKSRLQLIVENLISNAVKYYDPDIQQAAIAITAEEGDNCFLLSVRDNGLGVPKENQTQLFSMFKRFHTKVAFGSGLGLYMIQKSAEILGGVVEFESMTKGSQFTLKIPLIELLKDE